MILENRLQVKDLTVNLLTKLKVTLKCKKIAKKRDV